MLSKPQIPSPKKVSKIELQESETARFQAIGVVIGLVSVIEGKLNVLIDQINYPLNVAIDYKKAYFTLKNIATNSPKRLRLLVYPRCTHFPQKDKDFVLKFQLVAFSDVNKKSFFIPDWQFQLAGLWQFIPVSRCPVVSVFRNYDPDLLARFKAGDSMAKIWLAKTNHIPLKWRDAPVPPGFKKAGDDSKMPFVSIVATFKNNGFYFNSLQAMPCLPPRYIKNRKPTKAVKAVETKNKPAKPIAKPVKR